MIHVKNQLLIQQHIAIHIIYCNDCGTFNLIVIICRALYSTNKCKSNYKGIQHYSFVGLDFG
jgi:hypothetical protein